MPIPALAPLCLAAGPARALTAPGPFATALAAAGVHTAAILAVTGAGAVAACGWVGAGLRRCRWIGPDRLWAAALLVAGPMLINPWSGFAGRRTEHHAPSRRRIRYNSPDREARVNPMLRRLRGFWHGGLRANSPAAYLFAIACVGVTILVRLAIELIVTGVALPALYIPAVLVAALVGGASAGVVALVVGGFAAWAGLVSPSFPLVAPTLPQAVGLAVYAVSAGLTIGVAEAYRRAIRRVRQQEEKRHLLLRELQHRSGNTLAVVQAIVSQTLRENPEAAGKINGRIMALSSTNDLLMRSPDQTAELRDVLAAELKPYGDAQVVLQGAPVRLAPEIARALGLVCHELATNAVKHGALSTPEGRLAAGWTIDNGQVRITWVEKHGPTVAPPASRGFGTYFVERILASLDGMVTPEFRPEGFRCEISFPSRVAQPPPAPQTRPSAGRRL